MDEPVITYDEKTGTLTVKGCLQKNIDSPQITIDNKMKIDLVKDTDNCFYIKMSTSALDTGTHTVAITDKENKLYEQSFTIPEKTQNPQNTPTGAAYQTYFTSRTAAILILLALLAALVIFARKKNSMRTTPSTGTSKPFFEDPIFQSPGSGLEDRTTEKPDTKRHDLHGDDTPTPHTTPSPGTSNTAFEGTILQSQKPDLENRTTENPEDTNPSNLHIDDTPIHPVHSTPSGGTSKTFFEGTIFQNQRQDTEDRTKENPGAKPHDIHRHDIPIHPVHIMPSPDKKTDFKHTAFKRPAPDLEDRTTEKPGVKRHDSQ